MSLGICLAVVSKLGWQLSLILSIYTKKQDLVKFSELIERNMSICTKVNVYFPVWTNYFYRIINFLVCIQLFTIEIPWAIVVASRQINYVHTCSRYIHSRYTMSHWMYVGNDIIWAGYICTPRSYLRWLEHTLIHNTLHI